MIKPYDELVAKAEAAVSKVKDAELRRVAFEKVLDDLLGSKEQAAPSRASSPRKATRKRSSKPRASSPNSTRKRGGPKAYVTELVDEGFFKKPKTLAQVKAELSNRGHHIPLTSLSGPLQTLCQEKKLRRQLTKGDGKKQTFNYSEW